MTAQTWIVSTGDQRPELSNLAKLFQRRSRPGHDLNPDYKHVWSELRKENKLGENLKTGSAAVPVFSSSSSSTGVGGWSWWSHSVLQWTRLDRIQNISLTNYTEEISASFTESLIAMPELVDSVTLRSTFQLHSNWMCRMSCACVPLSLFCNESSEQPDEKQLRPSLYFDMMLM